MYEFLGSNRINYYITKNLPFTALPRDLMRFKYWTQTLDFGTSAHIPCVSFFATPGQWQCFTPFQSKGKIGPQNSLFQSSTAYLFLTLILTLKFLHPTEYSQSMSSTKLKWLFCIPTFCWAQMAICPMRYVAVMLCSWAAHIQFSYFWSVQKYWVNSWTAQITEVDTKPLHTLLIALCDGFRDKPFPF